MNDINGLNVTTTTLVGVSKGKYPLTHGNCFSMKADDEYEYNIVNFVYENLKEVIKLGVSLPIKLRPLGLKTAIIIDERIPDEWFSNKYCEVCCPEDLLPHPQRMAHLRQETRGERIIKTFKGDQFIKGPITIIMTDFNKIPKLGNQENNPKKLKTGWIIEEVINEAVVYSPPISQMSKESENELVSIMAKELLNELKDLSKKVNKE